MNNKNILIGVLVIIILILGFLYMRKSSNPVEIPNTNTNTNSQASGKLNIDAVCKGALAYMTFKDGAASDKFVADCKEGKYPEVIEKYKADMNLGAGATI